MPHPVCAYPHIAAISLPPFLIQIYPSSCVELQRLTKTCQTPAAGDQTAPKQTRCEHSMIYVCVTIPYQWCLVAKVWGKLRTGYWNAHPTLQANTTQWTIISISPLPPTIFSFLSLHHVYTRSRETIATRVGYGFWPVGHLLSEVGY